MTKIQKKILTIIVLCFGVMLSIMLIISLKELSDNLPPKTKKIVKTLSLTKIVNK